MSRADLAFAVGLVANAATFVQIVPQIARLLRLRRIEGASPLWAAGGMVINIGWAAFVIAEQVWLALPSVVAAVTGFAVVLWLLYRNGAKLVAAAIYAIAVGVACVALQSVAGWTMLGIVLALSNGLYLGPSVVAAWRSRVPVAVSPLTWVLTTLEGLLWGCYGVLVSQGPIMVYGATAVLLASAVLVRLWVARHRISAALPAPE